MKILEKLLEDTRNEAMEESQRKRELREEKLAIHGVLQGLIDKSRQTGEASGETCE